MFGWRFFAWMLAGAVILYPPVPFPPELLEMEQLLSTSGIVDRLYSSARHSFDHMQNGIPMHARISENGHAEQLESQYQTKSVIDQTHPSR